MRQQFYDLAAQLKEWRKRRGCIYTEGCEFHSISRPLTIERVRSSVCTQDISTERSFVEILRNAQRNLPSSLRSLHPPESPLSKSRFSRDFSPGRRKGFSITFCRRFCSAPLGFEPTSRGPFESRKKKTHPPGSFI